jgi:UDP-N-acetylmuramate dehydrogenase
MNIHENFSLKDILFYKIGGIAKYVLEVKNREELLESFEYIKKNNIQKYLVVGLGANLVMNDEFFDGAIVWINKNEKPDIRITENGLIAAYAGETLDDLINFCFANHLKGLEVLGGLPSTIGGAIRGNAGAFGVEMKDVIAKIEVLDVMTGVVKTLTREQCEFSYRNSMFKYTPNIIILRGFFRLQQATDDEVQQSKKVYEENIAYREKNHPVEYPSCGSVFKNIRGEEKVQKILSVWPDIEEVVKSKWHGKVSMGYVIKRLGFQGIQVGGAKITENHANYISNIDNAKYDDVVSIIGQIKKKFEETFGFSPDLEAEIVR